MKAEKLLNRTRGKFVASRVKLCQSLLRRLVGLLGTQNLPEDEAYWLIPCNSVHTLGMKYPIDVYFLDKKNRVISEIKNLKPNRFSPLLWKAHSALEFKAGTLKNIFVGDEISLEGPR